ncbi:hypothetical protein IWX64_000510 [Arthrobacter sp. CAN_A212]|uniref:DUF5819 family protein n=1 Tax=Arthrobacter sp. CAN_A212 TaxID=2787719 RepID=UPI0018CB5897
MKIRSYVPNSVKLTAGGLGLALAAHFTFTILHVTPVNPLKVEQERVVNAWVQPLFVQNWQLFAPDPIAHDQGLLVRARLIGGTGPAETDFVDITTPHLHHPTPAPAASQPSAPAHQLHRLRRHPQISRRAGISDRFTSSRATRSCPVQP